jgi:hypothetical protein
MACIVTNVEVWSGMIPNKPGGLATALGPLATVGADLSFVLARRQSHNPQAGVVYISSLGGAAQRKAARAAGFARATNLYALRVEGSNRAGLGAQMAQQLAAEGINLRGMSAVTMGRKFVAYLAFDNKPDATRAARALRKSKK